MGIKASNKKNIWKEAIILLLFILLAALMTYPLIFNLQKPQDLGDSLFISWTLAWDVHKLFTNPAGFFDANIFYPNHNTLAYSEHLFGLSILAAPVFLLSDKPIVSYNILSLLSFILSGYGTYLFSFYLTKNRFASIVAGIVFAFFPYRFNQSDHLHVISTQWIPFALLFLFRFFEYRDYKNIGLCLLFSLLQILSSGYLAIFFLACMAILGLFLFIDGKGYNDRQFMLKIIFSVIISIIILLPFYIPYVENQKYMGFVWDKSEIEYNSAKIENYIASTSRLYYPLTAKYGKPGSYLFPGIIPVVLAFIGLLGTNRNKDRETSKRMSIIVIDIGLVICFLLIIITIIFGGIDINLLFLRIRSHNLLKPWLIFTILLLIRKPLSKSCQPFLLSSLFRANKIQVSFLMLALLAVSISLGFGSLQNDSFYNFFYNYVPGFKFVRVTARTGMFACFFISLLSAYGVQRLMKPRVMKKFILIIIPIILLENASFPRELYIIEETPEVFQWLEKEKGDFSVIELPIDNIMLNFRYVYHSAKHWKKIVNGISGFFPPSDLFVQEASLKDLPTLLDYLNYIKVKYVIVHRDHINNSYLELIKKLKGRLVLKESLGSDDVYELKDQKQIIIKTTDLTGLKEITPERWTALTDYNDATVRFAFDGNLETRWRSGRQQHQGDSFTLDLHDIYGINAISIELGQYYREYPRKIILEVSEDGINWENTRTENNVLLDLLYSSIKTPKNVNYILMIKPIRARYIRLTLAEINDIFYWSVPEIKVFSSD